MIQGIPLKKILEAQLRYRTPFYLYDESVIIQNCQKFTNMPNAFGLVPSYAMKANSNLTILKIITGQGFHIDASSLNEAIKAHKYASVPYKNIELTSQEVHSGLELDQLKKMISKGMTYTLCSVQQLLSVVSCLSELKKPVSLRIHPDENGSGESLSRNTANKYSCFGIPLNEDLKAVEDILHQHQLEIERIHIHIGSGSDPEKWKLHVQKSLQILDEYFPTAKILNLGGGYKVARMPHEK